MTERMRLQVQASKMRFLRRIEEVALFNKVRSSEIRKSLNIEPLLLLNKRSQLRWFGHVSRMPQERLPKQALHAKANGRRPVGRPRTRWTDYIEDLGWNRLGLRSSEMIEVMEDREVTTVFNKRKLLLSVTKDCNSKFSAAAIALKHSIMSLILDSNFCAPCLIFFLRLLGLFSSGKQPNNASFAVFISSAL